MYSLSDLPALAASPYRAALASPFDSPAYVLIDARQPYVAASVQEQQRVAAYLRQQPCPVLALVAATEAGGHANPCSDPWRTDYDVCVDSEAAAATLIHNIQHAPLAAMTLVQVLRVSEHLPIAQGLLLESLAYASLQNGQEFQRYLAQRPPTRTTALPPDDGPAVVLEALGSHLNIRLNRPSRRNAFSIEMRDAVVEALQLVAADAQIESACLSGLGACFSSGGDLAEFGTAPDSATAHAIRSVRLPAATLQQCGGRVDFQVHGACIGAGLELPAFGRRVSAARKTFFQLPEIRFGLIPGAGGCVSIPRRIGRQRTAWLALSARRIHAETALAWGLIDAIE